MNPETLEYNIIDAPTAPVEETPAPDTSEPLRLTPELLEKFSTQSLKIRRLREMIERARQLPQQIERRQKLKTKARVKNAMSKASRKRNRRS
jgi:hypothetical protein